MTRLYTVSKQNQFLIQILQKIFQLHVALAEMLNIFVLFTFVCFEEILAQDGFEEFQEIPDFPGLKIKTLLEKSCSRPAEPLDKIDIEYSLMFLNGTEFANQGDSTFHMILNEENLFQGLTPIILGMVLYPA